MSERKFEVTAAQLKWLAIILMFVNHLCSCIFDYTDTTSYFFSDAHWYLTRFSFVIFAYQIAEGMHYTKNRKKYILSLFAFALISEIPYDFCFYRQCFYFANQNVLFDLAVSALAIAVIDKLDRKPIYTILVTLAAMAVAALLGTDYGLLAEPLIVCFYYFRDNKKKQLSISFVVYAVFVAVVYIYIYLKNTTMTIPEMFADVNFLESFYVELHGLLTWPLLMLYKGKKGKAVNKWFFYLFYPGHLLLITLITFLIT